MTFLILRKEAADQLLKVLRDPDDRTDNRQTDVEFSCRLSYRHLTEPAKRLFKRLSILPGGVWKSSELGDMLPWQELLTDDWLDQIEELDRFAMLHFEPDAQDQRSGSFQMLPAMIAFAKRIYQPDTDLKMMMPDQNTRRLVMKMEFRRFLNMLILIPAQIIKQGRRTVYRLLGYTEWLEPFLGAWQNIQALRC